MRLDLTVPDLACSACIETVTQAVHGVDAAAQVTADSTTKQVSIISEASETAVKDAITTDGYTVA